MVVCQHRRKPLPDRPGGTLTQLSLVDVVPVANCHTNPLVLAFRVVEVVLSKIPPHRGRSRQGPHHSRQERGKIRREKSQIRSASISVPAVDSGCSSCEKVDSSKATIKELV